MNLWIRSQYKEKLVEVTDLFISYSNDCLICCNHKPIDEYHCNFEELGAYSSHKRALEVLDEINKVKFYKYLAELNFEHFIKVIQKYNEKEKNILLNDMNTYEMPKE